MSRIPHRCWDLVVRLSLVMAVITSVAASAAAQSATGSIEGVVSDQSGAVLPGVTVTVTQAQTALSRSGVTDDQGIFRVPLLPVGSYDVSAELSGFTPRKESGIRLTVGQTLNLSIQLALASVSETVQVQSTTPVIETSKSQVSSTIGEVSVQNLPVNGRNFIDFAAATSASPVSAARSTRWWWTAPTTTTRSSDRRWAAPDRAARPISSARTRCRNSR
jgi:hypothetical protein